MYFIYRQFAFSKTLPNPQGIRVFNAHQFALQTSGPLFIHRSVCSQAQQHPVDPHTNMSDFNKAIYDWAQAQRKCLAVLYTVCSYASGNNVIFSEMPTTPTVPLRLQT